MPMNLLVVDWDFFFPTPMAGGPPVEHSDLYAWPVADDAVHVELIWLRRVRKFQAVGMPLPRCTGYEGFWDRFRISPRAKVYYADSNAWAGHLFPSNLGGEGPWNYVHLYDAHHDCGYRNNHKSFDQWKAAGRIGAENWMLAHYWNGSKLAVHFPPWRESMERPAESPLIPVGMTIDDGSAPEIVFDAVYLCRSGAWVPSWCDDQFSDFLEACPAQPVQIPQNRWNHPRPDVVRMAELGRSLGPRRGFVQTDT
ncbi:hypothetical protein [Streptomyces sp. NPDC015131]|uniref:hypothetical protein n=1 Tax=Streptomyces sp. NPDC015131 TaxID=3364941 RepID=UPI0037016D76